MAGEGPETQGACACSRDTARRLNGAGSAAPVGRVISAEPCLAVSVDLSRATPGGAKTPALPKGRAHRAVGQSSAVDEEG